MQLTISSSDYTFDASAKTITLIDPFDVITTEQIYHIINLSTGAIIYDSERRTHPITMAGAVITHTYDNTGMADADTLQISLDDGTSGGGSGGSSAASAWLGAEGAYLPQSDFSLTGTVTMTNASTAVTGSGTAFDTELQVNDYIKLDADTSSSWAKITSIETATGLTLTATYGGTGGAAAASGSGNPADISELLGTGRYMGHSVAKFDDTLANPDGGEKCGWRVPMPDYDGGNIVITAFSKPATTPTGAVTGQYNLATIGLANSEEFDSAIPVDTGVNISHPMNTTELSTDICVASRTIDPANVSDGDLMILELSRDVVSDNLSGDLELVGCLVEYTRS